MNSISAQPLAVLSLTTNKLITFFMLRCHYPVLQSINTYYSLIGAVYLYRHCA